MEPLGKYEKLKPILLLDCGGHGRVAAEICEDRGFQKIDYLDDNNSAVIGKIDDLEKFTDEFECAFVDIGNDKFRGELIQK